MQIRIICILVVQKILLPEHGSVLDVVVVLIGGRKYAIERAVHGLVAIKQLLITALTDRRIRVLAVLLLIITLVLLIMVVVRQRNATLPLVLILFAKRIVVTFLLLLDLELLVIANFGLKLHQIIVLLDLPLEAEDVFEELPVN